MRINAIATSEKDNIITILNVSFLLRQQVDDKKLFFHPGPTGIILSFNNSDVNMRNTVKREIVYRSNLDTRLHGITVIQSILGKYRNGCQKQ